MTASTIRTKIAYRPFRDQLFVEFAPLPASVHSGEVLADVATVFDAERLGELAAVRISTPFWGRTPQWLDLIDELVGPTALAKAVPLVAARQVDDAELEIDAAELAARANQRCEWHRILCRQAGIASPERAPQGEPLLERIRAFIAILPAQLAFRAGPIPLSQLGELSDDAAGELGLEPRIEGEIGDDGNLRIVLRPIDASTPRDIRLETLTGFAVTLQPENGHLAGTVPMKHVRDGILRIVRVAD
jgi:hypothetical protein